MVKSGLLPIFVNKILKYSYHAHLLHVVYGCFPATVAETDPQSPKYLLFGPL